MTKTQNSKPVFDLEERTFQFAKAVRLFVKKLPKTLANIEDGTQKYWQGQNRRNDKFPTCTFGHWIFGSEIYL